MDVAEVWSWQHLLGGTGIDAVEIGFVVSALCLRIAALGFKEGAQIQ